MMSFPCSPASFRRPKRMMTSAWIEHAPFAFWLIEHSRPRCVTELGTHYGFSYLCFCEQVQASALDTKCFAIDTWRGDEHSGFYGEDVFENLHRYHDSAYSNFSKLLRATFDEAVNQFDDGSIDLLHLDGRHFYEDVKHDFETWQRKLSSRAIVLFHDTQVREHGFGVYQFWEAIRRDFAHFEFIHGAGLGVLCVGRDPIVRALPIFQAHDEANVIAIRNAYETLGASVSGRRPLRRNDVCPCGSNKRFKHCHGSDV
jgi:Methyltransferase domain/SEC-C motif